eukprot:g1988.t1
MFALTQDCSGDANNYRRKRSETQVNKLPYKAKDSFRMSENPMLHDTKMGAVKSHVSGASTVTPKSRSILQSNDSFRVSENPILHDIKMGAVKSHVSGASAAATKSRSTLQSNPTNNTIAKNDFGWEKFVDSEGRIYYSNAVLGVSQWEIPWNEVVDESTGIPYFVNLVTGETTWSIPGEADKSRLNGSITDNCRDESVASEIKDRSEENAAEEDVAEEHRLRDMIEEAHAVMVSAACNHMGCASPAIYGRCADGHAVRCKGHKRSGDVLVLRMEVRERLGEWEEIVDNETGKTIYYHSVRDEIRQTKPERWVRMMANRFSTGTKAKAGK